MSRAWPWLAALGILVLAGIVVALEPPEQVAQGPFVVEVALDQPGTGRNIEASIHDVRLAEVVELDSLDGWRGETEGLWVVADVTAESRVKQGGLQSFLLIGDLEFRGSERLDLDGIESWVLSPGIPAAGTVLFEIPRELRAEATTARVMLGLSADWRLDSLVATTLDLSALEVQPTIVVPPAERVAP